LGCMECRQPGQNENNYDNCSMGVFQHSFHLKSPIFS
jgi:hypothetical protein